MTHFLFGRLDGILSSHARCCDFLSRQRTAARLAATNRAMALAQAVYVTLDLLFRLRQESACYKLSHRRQILDRQLSLDLWRVEVALSLLHLDALLRLDLRARLLVYYELLNGLRL